MLSNKEIRFKCITEAYQEVFASGLMLGDCHVAKQSLAPRNDTKCTTHNDNGLYEALNMLAHQFIQTFKSQTDEKFWELYWAKLEQAKAEYEDFDYNPVFEKEHIDFAIRNAFFAYFGLISIIPQVYFAKHGKAISAEDFRRASHNTDKLLDRLSKYHFDVFRAFIYATSKTNAGVSKDLHVFQAKCFELDDELVLSLTSEAISRIKVETAKLQEKGKLRVEQPTIGCPAVFVKDETEKPLTVLLHEMVLDYLDRSDFYSLSTSDESLSV